MEVRGADSTLGKEALWYGDSSIEVRKFLCIKGIYKEPGARFGLNRDWKWEGFQG